MTCLLYANRDISTWLPQRTRFGRVRSSPVQLSSTLERVPELLNLLWGQLLAPAHNAQHLFALDLALPFASRLRFHALAIGLGVEEPRQEFEARIGGGGVARENRRDDQKGLQGAAPAFPAARTKIAPRNRFNGATSRPAVMGARMPGAIPSRSAPPGSVIAAYPNGACRRKAKMSALSKVKMSVSCPSGSRSGGCRTDERGADEQTRT